MAAIGAGPPPATGSRQEALETDAGSTAEADSRAGFYVVSATIRPYTAPIRGVSPVCVCARGGVNMRTALLALLGSLIGSSFAAADTPTFYKDVLPILQT